MDKHNTSVSTTPLTQSSAAKWLFICFGAAAAAFIAIAVFKVSVSNLFTVGILLACPLMHLWMMKSGNHKH